MRTVENHPRCIETRWKNIEPEYDKPFKVIDMTGVDRRELAAKAYEVSKPQGMGILHFTPGPLDTGTLNEISTDEWSSVWGKNMFLKLDYVKGRALKVDVVRTEHDKTNLPEECKLWMHADWYDHSPSQTLELLDSLFPEYANMLQMELSDE